MDDIDETDPELDALVAGAVGVHHTGTDNGSWDASAAVRRLGADPSQSTIRAMFAWVPDGDITKSNSRYPHHDVNSNGSVGSANLRGCSAGIAALNGGRGGTTIPDSDRRGVYAHLAAHLRDGGRTDVPTLTAAAEAEHTHNEEPVVASVEAQAEAETTETEPTFTEVSESALVAAVIVAEAPAEPTTDLFNPPGEWFDDPGLDRPTHLTVEPSGRVFGHLARWDTPHIGIRDRQVRPPRSESNYGYFRTGTRRTTNGSVPTGPLTIGTGHAPLQADASAAAEHYDNTGAAVADVAVGEDDIGIWVAGALRPGVSPERVLALCASDISGDWRAINNRLELVGILSVNVAGFPVTALAASGLVMPTEYGYRAGMRDDNVVSLVAAGIIEADPRGDEVRELRSIVESWRPLVDALRPLAIERLVASIQQ